MELTGYRNRASFWEAVKRSGMPFIRINSRRCLFEEHALHLWLKSRTIGKKFNQEAN